MNVLSKFQKVLLFSHSASFFCFFYTSFNWSPSDSKSPILFWVFLLILTVLWSGCSLFFLWFPVTPISFLRPWGPFQGHQLQLLSPLPSIAFSTLWQDPSIVCRFAFFYLSSMVHWTFKIYKMTSFFLVN